MNFLSSVITYVRRIVKTPSNQEITDALIVDYINRFWLMDMDARLQLFDLKTRYSFQTVPGIDQYNTPLYTLQSIDPNNDEQGSIASFPVYQGFMGPARINGIGCQFYTQRSEFYNIWPNYLNQNVQVATGDGSAGPYTISIPFFPAIPGHVDITGVIAANSSVQDPIYGTTLNLKVPMTSVYSGVYFTATGDNGQNIVVQDSGQFLSNSTGGDIYGLLMTAGNIYNGYRDNNSAPLSGNTYSMTQNTINYNTGVATNLYFPSSIPAGAPITAACYSMQQGLPRAVLFYNNIITLRNPPDRQYLVELDAYLTPAAFLSTDAVLPFAYMAEYIARGAARKILSDTGDVEQFMFYEPLFKEQELLVWKRSQRQFTANRTQTIYSGNGIQGNYTQSSQGV